MCPRTCQGPSGRPDLTGLTHMSRARMALLVVLVACAAGTGVALAAFSKTTANVGSTFSTASSFSSCPNTTLMPNYLTGFEMGRRAAQGATNIAILNPAIVDGTVARTGGYSARFAPTSGAPQQ